MAMNSEKPRFDVRTARALGRGRHRHRVLRLPLASLRNLAGKTQAGAAEGAGMAQGDVSRLETRASFDDCTLGTLRRYFDGVGAKLEAVAVFPSGHRIAVELGSVEDSEENDDLKRRRARAERVARQIASDRLRSIAVVLVNHFAETLTGRSAGQSEFQCAEVAGRALGTPVDPREAEAALEPLVDAGVMERRPSEHGHLYKARF